ncbi:MAG: UDP-N-acetyl-D-mannosamine dehydrogenase, partial [Pararheinheimera sp.]|nr:UDP-N-acetyl-D-mannosamine dehydrogenase [Rheinheimera sp.]
GKIYAVEPNVEKTNKLASNVELVSVEQGLKADIIVILVNHKGFGDLDFSKHSLINVVGPLRSAH